MALDPRRRLAGRATPCTCTPDRRQGPPRQRTAREPLVEFHVVRDRQRAHDLDDAPRPGLRSRSTSTSSRIDLDVSTVDGARRSIPLEDRPVAEFHQLVMALYANSGQPRRSGRYRSRSSMRSRLPTTMHSPLRPRRRAAILACAGRDAAGVQRVPDSIRRQGQPGAPVLGSPRPRLHPVLGSHSTCAPRWRTELRAARDVGGVLTRSAAAGTGPGHPVRKACSTLTSAP